MQKLLERIILSILIIFPFGELLRFSIGNDIVVKPIDLLVGIIALLWFFYSFFNKRGKEKKQQEKIGIGIFLFAGIAMLSLLINSSWLQQNELFTALLYLIRWISYASLFFIVVQFGKSFKSKLRFLLFIDGFIILLIGYLQYFFFPSLQSLTPLGWDEHMYRMFSVFLDPNFAGAFFVLYFLFVGGLILTKGERGISTHLLYLALFLSLFAIFLTFSRSALVMLLIGSGIFLILLKKTRIFVGIMALTLLFFIVLSPYFYIENLNLFRGASSHARIENYTSALGIIADNPLLGIGFNAYRYAKDAYGIQSGWAGFPSHADAGVDNSFLFVLATTGFIGFSSYLFLLFQMLTESWNSFVKEKKMAGVVIFASIISLCINALFINSLFFSGILLWLWVSVALMKE